jgi:hypothetical protein
MSWGDIIKQQGDRQQRIDAIKNQKSNTRKKEIDAFVKQTKQELLKAIDDAVKDSYAPNEQTIYKAIREYASSMTHGWN